MTARFETLGNASVLVTRDDHTILATDPWLIGTCYYGSWALDHPLSDRQIAAIVGADYIWISHGHPDHLHDESLALLPTGKHILLPDHYNTGTAEYLRDRGFVVTILTYRAWFDLAPGIRIMCLDNINQDAVLVIRADDNLIVNLNDSPLCGEGRFLRSLIRGFPRERTYLLALCSVDADMFNLVDERGASLAGPPEERKRGAIWQVARTADRLGVGTFSCSSSQHIYVRSDSIWANPYRISWADMQRHWSRPRVRLLEPFVTVDLTRGEYTRNHPSQESDRSQISECTGEDDWEARLSAEDWRRVEVFIRKFEMVRKYIDYVVFEVGGEARRFALSNQADAARARGVVFIVPRESLMNTVEYGYLDDLLIGNFMKMRLINTSLYPRFTPLVAKVGGNAKVYTREQYRRFRWHYIRRNPLGMLLYLLEVEFNHSILPWLRHISDRFGFKRPLKYIYRRMILADPADPRHEA